MQGREGGVFIGCFSTGSDFLKPSYMPTHSHSGRTSFKFTWRWMEANNLVVITFMPTGALSKARTLLLSITACSMAVAGSTFCPPGSHSSALKWINHACSLLKPVGCFDRSNQRKFFPDEVIVHSIPRLIRLGRFTLPFIENRRLRVEMFWMGWYNHEAGQKHGSYRFCKPV